MKLNQIRLNCYGRDYFVCFSALLLSVSAAACLLVFVDISFVHRKQCCSHNVHNAFFMTLDAAVLRISNAEIRTTAMHRTEKRSVR